MLIDLSSNQQYYPFDESKVRLEFEFIEHRKPFKKKKVSHQSMSSVKTPKLTNLDEADNANVE